MTVQPTLFIDLFALWPHDGETNFRDIKIASDMGVPRNRARQWISRGYVPPWYWPRMVDVIEQRFGRIVTYRQLVEASAAIRGPDAKREASAGQAEAA